MLRTKVTTTARGYGASHQAERERWRKRLRLGAVVQCACTGECLRHLGRCPVVITAASAWDLMHTPDRTGYLGPGCVPCNRTDGALRSNGTIPPAAAPADRW